MPLPLRDDPEDWMPKFDWNINARKAATQLLYSVFALMLGYISAYVIPGLGGHWLVLVPFIQAALKSAMNWLQEHIQ